MRLFAVNDHLSREGSSGAGHMRVAKILTLGWCCGAAFTGLLVYLDYETVHTVLQIPVFLLSLPQATLAVYTANLIRDPANYSQSLFNALIVFWGGCIYAVFALLVTGAWQGKRARRSSTDENTTAL
jgi:hypothetical protein